jgi:hypothetical protein
VSARKHDLQMVTDVASHFGIDRRAFGALLERQKASGHGGTANERGDFTYAELMDIASAYAEELVTRD